MPIPTKEMVEANRRNQDPIHREQQRLFLLLGQLHSTRSQILISIPDRNSHLTKPLDLVKYEAIVGQLSIQLRNLISQVETQMKNLKEIVGSGDKK